MTALGDLTASEEFQESKLFYESDLFGYLEILTQSELEMTNIWQKNEEIFGEETIKQNSRKFNVLKTIVWIVANSIADDTLCQ